MQEFAQIFVMVLCVGVYIRVTVKFMSSDFKGSQLIAFFMLVLGFSSNLALFATRGLGAFNWVVKPWF